MIDLFRVGMVLLVLLMDYHYFLIPWKSHVSFVQEGEPLIVCLAA